MIPDSFLNDIYHEIVSNNEVSLKFTQNDSRTIKLRKLLWSKEDARNLFLLYEFN